MSIALQDPVPAHTRRRGRHPIKASSAVGTASRPRAASAIPVPGRATSPAAVGGSDNRNGVDLDAREQLVADVSSHPETSGTAWQADAVWRRGLRSVATVRGFEPIAADGPVEFGGTDTAPHPVEALLAAMANCLVAAYAAHASSMGIDLTDLRVRVAGELRLDVLLGLAQGHAGFDRVRASVTLRGSASPQELAELHESVVATSPIGHTIANAVPIRIHLS